MGVVSYLTIDDEIVSETRSGVESDYIPDSLGDTVALLGSGQTITDTWGYWPFGEVRFHNGTSVTSITYVGTLGYYQDAVGDRYYVRARILRSGLTRWQTLDPLWKRSGLVRNPRLAWLLDGFVSPYAYGRSNPVTYFDYSGRTVISPPQWGLLVNGGTIRGGPPIGGFSPVVGGGVLGGVVGLVACAMTAYTGRGSLNDNSSPQDYYNWCMSCCTGLFEGIGAGVVGGLLGGATIGIGAVFGAVLGGVAGHLAGNAVCPSFCGWATPVPPPVDLGPVVGRVGTPSCA